MTRLRVPAAMIAVSVMTAACARDVVPPGDLGASAPAGTLETQYRLGAGDKLRVVVFGEDTLTGEYTVSDTGAIAFPLIGNVPAMGRSVTDLQTGLRDKLAGGYIRDPRVSVEVLAYRPFYILGEVSRPGSYTFSVGLTLQQAVASAGGFTYRARTKQIYLKRAGEAQERAVPLTGAPLAVLPGDTIRVAERHF